MYVPQGGSQGKERRAFPWSRTPRGRFPSSHPAATLPADPGPSPAGSGIRGIPMDFVHLHVHSQFSLLDSTIRIDDLVKHVSAQGMTALALTDHMNVFGGLQFLKACRNDKAGINLKPIFGSEVVVADPETGRRHHLVLLCRNPDGFANLRTLLSRAYTDPARGDGPATLTRDGLAAHSKGLIALSGCLGGEVPQALLRGDLDGAREAAAWHAEVFGPGSYYLEVANNGLAEQERVNRALADLSRETGVPLVATANAHYLRREDAAAHAVLVAIEMKRNLTAEALKTLPLDSFHLASPDEMAASFADLPEALANTVRIAESIEGPALLTTKKHHFPIFAPPDGKTVADYFREITFQGVRQRLAEARRLGLAPDETAYNARVERELDVIIKLGFDAYYLVVRDFITWAKEHDIPVGPGRGSGAGSLVAFAVGITDIDPMRYDLLFERFLNPERISPPDFDIDFCMEQREQVIQYVTEHYGRERVCQIITFNAMKAKAVIRDGSRVLGLSFQEGDAIAKLIPDALDMTLEKAWNLEPRLQELIKGNPTYQTLWDVALRLEGLARQPGKHAAGVVIADRPVEEYAPLFVTDDGSVVTQFNMKDLDYVGLIKFDFLGLTSLTVIDNAVKTIRARGNPGFRIEEIPLDDKPTFDLICSGGTAGVFQLETRGITELVRRLRPDRLEDIIAIIALFRPGPLGSGMVEEFIAVKHGEKEASYPIEELRPILGDTYGTILYQEQVMLITSGLAGFSLGQADILRRAMGKKDMKALQEQREPFLKGCAERGIDVGKAADLFKNMEFFAEYGFNKSHSAAYAYVTYRMAYLKAHHPTEFLCSVLTAEKGDQAKVMRFIHEARLMGVAVLPPDVNRSGSDFTVEDVDDGAGGRKGAIRFGMTAVKGIGTSAVDAILEARVEEPFRSVMDFLSRVDTRKVNKRVIEALARCGAMDGFGHTRASIVEGLDALLSAAQRRREDRSSGQGGLFDDLPVSKAAEAGPTHVPEWPDRQKLAYEREAIGYYVSGHPLDRYAGRLERMEVAPIGDLPTLEDGETVRVAGIVLARNDKVAKASGNRFAYLTVEDASGQCECFVGGRTYPQLEHLTDLEEPVLVSGTVQIDSEKQQMKLMVQTIERLEAARRNSAKAVVVRLDLSLVRESTVDSLLDLARRFKGPCPLELRLNLPGAGEMFLRAGMQWQVNPCDELVADIERLLGPGSAVLT